MTTEAQRLAEWLDIFSHQTTYPRPIMAAAAHLRRLEAECEQLRADAARYRWLRQGDNDEQVMRFHEWATEVCVDPPPMYLPRLERLDRYIDAAIAKETK